MSEIVKQPYSIPLLTLCSLMKLSLYILFDLLTLSFFCIKIHSLYILQIDSGSLTLNVWRNWDLDSQTDLCLDPGKVCVFLGANWNALLSIWFTPNKFILITDSDTGFTLIGLIRIHGKKNWWSKSWSTTPFFNHLNCIHVYSTNWAGHTRQLLRQYRKMYKANRLHALLLNIVSIVHYFDYEGRTLFVFSCVTEAWIRCRFVALSLV